MYGDKDIMTKSRDSIELPDYEAQRTSLLGQGTSDASTDVNTALVRESGMISVDVIWYPYFVTSATNIELRPPVTLLKFLIDYDPNYHNVLEVVREQLVASKLIDFTRFEYTGVRMQGKGPVLTEAAWARIGSKVHRIEAMFDLPIEEKQRMHRDCQRKAWRVPTAIAGAVLLSFLLILVMTFAASAAQK